MVGELQPAVTFLRWIQDTQAAGVGAKCLTVLEPWASSIIYLGKPVENRSWPTPYRGPLLIHAGVSDRLLGDGLEFLRYHGLKLPVDPAAGKILGMVWLTDCISALGNRGWVVRDSCRPWADLAGWYWMLRNAVAFPEPIPCRGRQKLYDVTEPGVLKAIEAQLERASQK